MKMNFINRKKKLDTINVKDTKLSRVLNVFDLSTLGILFTYRPGNRFARCQANLTEVDFQANIVLTKLNIT